MKASRPLLLLGALALFACRGGVAPASAGATLQGSVSTSSSQGLRVAVPGTSLSTTTDTNGGFLILNVPAGVTSLRFTGGAVDATLPITSTLSRERRGMAVSADGHDAEEHHEQSEDEFRGTITEVAPPNLKVAGRPVTTTSTTTITLSRQPVALGALTEGDFAEVEGALQADGSVIARSISAHPPRTDGGRHDGGDDGENDDGDDDLSSFVGTLSNETDATLTVSGVTVTTTATTTYYKRDLAITRGDLAMGNTLLVRGTPTGEHAMTAVRIAVIVPETEGNLRVAGAISALDAGAGTFSVGTTALTADANTHFGGAGDPHALSDLHVHDLVFVAAVRKDSGPPLAVSVTRYLPPPPPTNEVEARGPISDKGLDGLSVNGQRFAVDAHTVVTKDGATIAFSALVNGEQVEVHGMPRDGGLPPIATRIEAH
jgi:hypothetical protein